MKRIPEPELHSATVLTPAQLNALRLTPDKPAESLPPSQI